MSQKELRQNQVNINERLDNLIFKVDDDFASGYPHPENRVSFAVSGETIDLYKGDTKINGSGIKRGIMAEKEPYGEHFMFKTSPKIIFDGKYGSTEVVEGKSNSWGTCVPLRGSSTTLNYRAIYTDASSSVSVINSNYMVGGLESIKKSTYPELKITISRSHGTMWYSENLTYTIFPGCISPSTGIAINTASDVTRLTDRSSVGVMPMIKIKHYDSYTRTTKNGYYLYYPEHYSDSETYNGNIQAGSFLSSKGFDYLYSMNYNWPDEANTPEFLNCGLCLLFFKDTMVADSNGLFSDNCKPMLGLFTGTSWWDEISWGLKSRYSSSPYKLTESEEPLSRLGLTRDIETGGELGDYKLLGSGNTYANAMAYRIYRGDE